MDDLKELTHKELLQYIENLQNNIEQEKPPKNSNNSSIPTSKEIAPSKKKKNQSLRKISGKNGGQFGHQGVTLQQSDTPDEIVNITFDIDSCQKCGYDITNVLKELKEKRQIVDLDLQKTNSKITQYQSYSKECPKCGFNNHANNYPNFVVPHISYGKNIMAIVSYLSIVHYLSYSRIVSTLQTMYNITISEGSVDNLLKKASRLSQDEIDTIVSQLEFSDVVGIDETGVRVDGNRYWHWVFQNNTSTYIVANHSRGAKVIEENFENGFVKAIVVHDNYSSYNNLIANGEQLCLAHKLRDINYAIECDNTKLMKDMKHLIIEAMNDHKLDLSIQQRKILKQQYEQTFKYLLTRPTIPKSETDKQIRSLTKSKDKIFTFLYYQNVPPDNNGSERAIRNVKVKLKVSGQFKSFQGAKDYATLRSIVDTARKRGLNEFETIRDVIGGKSVF